MIYVHVPFCGSFCTYCDFYSEIARSPEVRDRYVEDICAEASRRQEEIRRTLAIRTLYFGGGTPSVLPLSCLERIVRAVDAGPCDEFTVEVNPEDIVEKGSGYVRSLQALGVNRISMGVQSLDDGMLGWMRRRHDAAGARQAFRLLREAGMENVSVDVIFGVAQMSDEMLAGTLEELLDWGPEHISAYQLSIEPDSALGQMHARGQYTPASDEQCRRQYDLLCERLGAAGFHHYEISNWARLGREALHNSAYWCRAAYVGLGPGAHSFDGVATRSWNSMALSGWTAESETLDAAAERTERIMLGLRTDRGIDASELTVGPSEHLSDATERLLQTGALQPLPGSRIRIPKSRWFVSDGIISELI